MILSNVKHGAWVAVQIWNADGEAIGYDCFSFSQWCNRPWWPTVGQAGLTIQIMGQGNKADILAHIAALRGIAIDKPVILEPVRCSNGQDYASAAIACAELGIDRSNMRKHLLGHAGYRTVKGLQFMHIALDDMCESR